MIFRLISSPSPVGSDPLSAPLSVFESVPFSAPGISPSFPHAAKTPTVESNTNPL